jgi:hypothetical protein
MGGQRQAAVHGTLLPLQRNILNSLVDLTGTMSDLWPSVQTPHKTLW